MTRQRRMLVLAICCMSLLIVGLDNTIVNVALPSIQRELHASVSGLQWTVDAYTLVLASLLMLSGSTADRLGRRRTFQTGLIVFTLGSLLCSVAPGLGWLVVFRMVQAVGGSMLNPVSGSSPVTTRRRRAGDRYLGVRRGQPRARPSDRRRARRLDWRRSIFWISVPVGIIALSTAAVRRSRAGATATVIRSGNYRAGGPRRA